MRTCLQKGHPSQSLLSAILSRPKVQLSVANQAVYSLSPVGNHSPERQSPATAATAGAEKSRSANVDVGSDFSRIPVSAAAPPAVQAKRTDDSAEDGFEQEAEQISEQIMRMPDSQAQDSCSCAAGCPQCKSKPSLQKSPGIQTRRLQGSAAQTGPIPPAVQEVLATPGTSLDEATRSFMGSRFRQDFSQVRVHTDAKAAESAMAMNALAYTVGRHVVFGAGQYAPEKIAGRRLLAHELTHVVQQNSGSRPFLQRAKIPYGQLSWSDFKAQPPAANPSQEGAGIHSGFDLPGLGVSPDLKKTRKSCTTGKQRSNIYEAKISISPTQFDTLQAYMDQDKSWALERYTSDGTNYCRGQVKKCENEFDAFSTQTAATCQQVRAQCEDAFRRKQSAYGYEIGNQRITINKAADCRTRLVTWCQDLYTRGHSLTRDGITATTKAGCERAFFRPCMAGEPAERARLLKHEQSHFEISKVLADKAREDLKAKAATLTVKETGCGQDEASDAALRKYNIDVEPVLKNLGRAWQQLKDRTQDEYDVQTSHGSDAPKQTAWESKIAAKLPGYQVAAPSGSTTAPTTAPTTTPPTTTPPVPNRPAP